MAMELDLASATREKDNIVHQHVQDQTLRLGFGYLEDLKEHRLLRGRQLQRTLEAVFRGLLLRYS